MVGFKLVGICKKFFSHWSKNLIVRFLKANIALAYYINRHSDGSQKIDIEWKDSCKDDESNVELIVDK